MNKDKNSQDPNGFAPEIVAIEQEIVEFFAAKSSEYTGRNPIIAKVMTYFCARRKLTQHDLQILTGYSAGTISKSVHQLLEMNVITKEIIPGTHTHIYKMEKLPFVSPRYFLRTEIVMDEKIRELEEMKKTLNENVKEMEKLEAYKKIYTTITELLDLLPKVHVFIEKLEEQIKQN